MAHDPRRLVLVDPSPDDYVTLAGWLRRGTALTTLYAGGGQAVSADDLATSSRLGHETYMMVVSRSDDRRIGFVSYRRTTGLAAYDVGIGLGDPDEWGAGFGPEAFALLLDVLFHRLGAHRVQVSIAAYNRHSLALLDRGGFTIEGVLRDVHYLDGERHDAVIASILRHEYYANDTYLPIPDVIAATEKARARHALAKMLARQGTTFGGGASDADERTNGGVEV